MDIFVTRALSRISLNAFFAFATTGRARSASAPARMLSSASTSVDLAAERGINGAQFHADVTAADDEQVFGNVLDFERAGGGHHARVAEVKRLGHGRKRTDGENRLVVFDELLPLLRLDAQLVASLQNSRGPG